MLSDLKDISLTRAQLLTLIGSSALITGKRYFITDKLYYLTAIAPYLVARQGTRVMLVPASYIDGTFNAQSWRGVFNPNSSYTTGDHAIWAGKVWTNNAGVTGVATDDYTLDSHWTYVNKATFSAGEYVYMDFGIFYDLTNDWIEGQFDELGNEFGMSYALAVDSGYSDVNRVDISDWNLKSHTQFYGNKCAIGIYNNSCSGSIYHNFTAGVFSNKVPDGSIYENYASIIASNTIGSDFTFNKTIGPIANNTTEGNLKNNKCEYIINNAITGEITFNVMTGNIHDNLIDGNITANTISGDIIGNEATVLGIENNSNTGSITNNSHTGGIYYNSNRGNISSNSMSAVDGGDISYNSNSGDISGNDMTSTGASVSNLTGIYYNTNAGSITGNSMDAVGGFQADSRIYANTNAGLIADNTNQGSIANNACGGDINENTNLGSIFSNLVGGGINSNNNTGYITGNVFSGPISNYTDATGNLDKVTPPTPLVYSIAQKLQQETNEATITSSTDLHAALSESSYYRIELDLFIGNQSSTSTMTVAFTYDGDLNDSQASMQYTDNAPTIINVKQDRGSIAGAMKGGVGTGFANGYMRVILSVVTDSAGTLSLTIQNTDFYVFSPVNTYLMPSSTMTVIKLS